MAVIQDPQVAHQVVGGVIQLDVGPASISVVNLGALGAQSSGPIPLTNRTQTFSLQQPDGSDRAVTVGESFSMVRTETNTTTGAVIGTPTVSNYTMVGSGTVTGLLGTPRQVIVATNNDTGQQEFIYPNNVPPNLLGLVTLSYEIDSVGYDFEANAPLCFAAGTLIETESGLIAVEDLTPGMRVMTLDNGLRPISWIGSSEYGTDKLAANPLFQPIRIKAGALGENTPTRDLIVSPQHRILVRSKIAQKMFGCDEVLVAAKQLVLIEGIDVAHDMESVVYYHFLFDRHEIVLAEGAAAESLYTGSEALKSVGRAAQEEIFAIFPELREQTEMPAGARTLMSGRRGRKMALRHAQHGRPLVSNF